VSKWNAIRRQRGARELAQMIAAECEANGATVDFDDGGKHLCATITLGEQVRTQFFACTPSCNSGLRATRGDVRRLLASMAEAELWALAKREVAKQQQRGKQRVAA
jgi:hypothetical protein